MTVNLTIRDGGKEVYKGAISGRVIQTELDELGFEQMLREVLSGHVYKDENGNRVRDKGRRAVEIPAYLEELGFEVEHSVT